MFIASLSARTQSKSYAIARRQVHRYVKHTFVIENIGVLSYYSFYDLILEYEIVLKCADALIFHIAICFGAKANSFYGR